MRRGQCLYWKDSLYMDVSRKKGPKRAQQETDLSLAGEALLVTLSYSPQSCKRADICALSPYIL